MTDRMNAAVAAGHIFHPETNVPSELPEKVYIQS